MEEGLQTRQTADEIELDTLLCSQPWGSKTPTTTTMNAKTLLMSKEFPFF